MIGLGLAAEMTTFSGAEMIGCPPPDWRTGSRFNETDMIDQVIYFSLPRAPPGSLYRKTSGRCE